MRVSVLRIKDAVQEYIFLTSGLEAGIEGARAPLIVETAVLFLSTQRFTRDGGQPVGGVDGEVWNAFLWPIASPVMEVICEGRV